MNDNDVWLRDLLESKLESEPAQRLGIAVSGGSDSLALLYLAATVSSRAKSDLSVVTIDHGIRPESGAEAQEVALICQRLGLDHFTINWNDLSGSGNLQDQARRARYRLIADWAKGQGIGAVLLGHTADDQAETFLMRLAREAGVDGLSGMQARRQAHGMVWLRPLLQVRRQQLRDYLTVRGLSWFDDPSNLDERFDRVRVRNALAVLDSVGIDVSCLVGVAQNLSMARAALEIQTKAAAESVATIDAGDVVFDRRNLMAQPQEIGRRLLVHALKWVSSAEYGPRRTALKDAFRNVSNGRNTTLHGCLVVAVKTQVRVTREWQSVKDEACPTTAVWDGRWRVSGPHNNDLTVRALGERGLRFCPNWRESGRPRSALLASPAVWQGMELVAAPLAGQANGWSAELIHTPNHFNASIISH